MTLKNKERKNMKNEKINLEGKKEKRERNKR